MVHKVRFIRQMASAVLVNLARTIYLTTLTWTAMNVGGSFAAIGQVLLWGSTAGLIVSPFAGVLIDKKDRKRIALGAALLFCLVMGLLSLAMTYSRGMFFIWIGAALVGIAQAIVIPTQEAILQSATPIEKRRALASLLSMMRQMGLIAGTLVGGILVGWDARISFGAAAIAMGASALLLIGATDKAPAQARATVGQFFISLKEGGRYFLLPAIFAAVLITTSAYAIGQVANASLPSYVHVTLGLSVWHFGFIDSMWSCGAFSAALIIGIHRRLREKSAYAQFGLLAMALFLALLNVYPNFIWVAGLFFFLGMGFSFTKVLSDGYLLQYVPDHMFGRVRSNVNTMSSIFGICIYMLPSFVPDMTAQNFLNLSAFALIIVFILAMLLMRKKQRL